VGFVHLRGFHLRASRYGGQVAATADLIESAEPSTIARQNRERAAVDGGESGIRTLAAPLDSVSYRFHIARVAVDASDVVAPCTGLHRARGERDGNSGALRSWNRCAINASLVGYRNVEFRFLRSGTADEIVSDTSTDSNRTRRRVRDARSELRKEMRVAPRSDGRRAIVLPSACAAAAARKSGGFTRPWGSL
jgi:hypothetical protein